MTTKKCSKCGVEKDLTEFHKRKNRPNGTSQCKECVRAYGKSEAHKRAVKTWQQENKDKTRAISKKWHEANPEVVRRIRRKSYETNLEKQKMAARQWIKDHPEQARETNRRYLRNNPAIQEALEVGLRISILLRDTILRRDGYECQLCHANSRLVMHHIVPKTQAPELVAEDTNLVTLCRECHKTKAHAGCFRRLDLNIAEQLTAVVRSKEIVNG